MQGMKKKLLWYAWLGMAIFTSCEQKKVASPVEYPEDETADSAREAADSIEFIVKPESEEKLPDTADELFDDFVFEFARLKSVQLKRVNFPLPVVEFGDTTWVQADNWEHEYLFLNQDFYTVFFNDESQMELEKSTDLERVDVEWLMPEQEKVRVYTFEREQGRWRLVMETIRPFNDSPLADFMRFYQRFAEDDDFQQASVASQLHFITIDPDDDFNMIEGTLSREQWETFKPQLPSGTLTNIRYGQEYHNPNRMILVKRGIANGLMEVLSFRKTDDSWKLVSFEN